MGSNEVDVVDNGAIVKVFLLEGAFPSSKVVPDSILDNAGSFFSNYGVCVCVCVCVCGVLCLLYLPSSLDLSVRVFLEPRTLSPASPSLRFSSASLSYSLFC